MLITYIYYLAKLDLRRDRGGFGWYVGMFIKPSPERGWRFNGVAGDMPCDRRGWRELYEIIDKEVTNFWKRLYKKYD